MAKKNYSINMEEWIRAEILRQYPEARRNFSKVVVWMLVSMLNNPVKYWREKARLYSQLRESAIVHLRTLEEIQQQQKIARQQSQLIEEEIIK